VSVSLAGGGPAVTAHPRFRPANSKTRRCLSPTIGRHDMSAWPDLGVRRGNGIDRVPGEPRSPVAASIGALDRRETCVHAEVCAGTPTWSPSARSPPPERAAGGRKARSSSAEQSGAVSRAAAAARPQLLRVRRQRGALARGTTRGPRIRNDWMRRSNRDARCSEPCLRRSTTRSYRPHREG
jgi:hypothetical protein